MLPPKVLLRDGSEVRRYVHVCVFKKDTTDTSAPTDADWLLIVVINDRLISGFFFYSVCNKKWTRFLNTHSLIFIFIFWTCEHSVIMEAAVKHQQIDYETSKFNQLSFAAHLTSNEMATTNVREVNQAWFVEFFLSCFMIYIMKITFLFAFFSFFFLFFVPIMGRTMFFFPSNYTFFITLSEA